MWCNVQSALRTLAGKVAQSKLTINSFPWQSYLTRRGKNPKQNPDSRTMSRIWTQRIVRRMDIGVTKLGQCNIRSTKHVLVEISNFFDPPNIFCTKPNGSIYSINISGRESALAAKRERVVYTLEPERARSWQDFLVQYLERVQYSGFKPCAVIAGSQDTRSMLSCPFFVAPTTQTGLSALHCMACS